MQRRSGLVGLVWAVVASCALAQDQGEVSIYCSLDIDFARQILLDFESNTGIKVRITNDTEDNKTVGMVNKIISEQANPRCDVFWNNEVGQTVRLKQLGLLQPYSSPGAAGIPAAFKDAEGYWTGFAARARVFIVNRDRTGTLAKPTGLGDLVDPRWAGKITMAKPLTGTTLTNMAALFSIWGETKTKEFIDQLLANDIYWSRGNAMVMRDVGEGAFIWGFTDTDDANVSRTVKKHPTDVIIPDQGEGGLGTLVIPNSVMIVKGAKNLDNAKKLVDYILTIEVEARLAAGPSAQIPLRPGVKVPNGVLSIDKLKAIEVDWNQVAAMIEQHGDYLHRRFEGGGDHAGTKSSTALWVLVSVAVLGGLIALGRRSAVR